MVKITPFGLPELQSPFDVAILVTQIGMILNFIFYSVGRVLPSQAEPDPRRRGESGQP